MVRGVFWRVFLEDPNEADMLREIVKEPISLCETVST